MTHVGEQVRTMMRARPPGSAATLPNVVLTIVIGLGLVACGATPSESEGPESSEAAVSQPGVSEAATTVAPSGEPASIAPEPASGAPVGEAGSFTVNGTEFAATLLNRCVPFSDAPGNLDLQALAQGAQLNLVLLGDTVEVSVQGIAIESEFGSIAFGQDPVVNESSVADDRWTGTATVADSLGSGDTVGIVWDVQIPSDVNDCSL